MLQVPNNKTSRLAGVPKQQNEARLAGVFILGAAALERKVQLQEPKQATTR